VIYFFVPLFLSRKGHFNAPAQKNDALKNVKHSRGKVEKGKKSTALSFGFGRETAAPIFLDRRKRASIIRSNLSWAKRDRHQARHFPGARAMR